MKKLFKLLAVAFASLVLVACGNGGTKQTETSNSSSSKEAQVQLIVKKDSDTQDKKVKLNKDQTAMDILKENYQVEEKDGFITSIDGLKQDEAAGKYWMFKVNDEVAPKAANQIKLKDGDKVEFYQEVYQQK